MSDHDAVTTLPQPARHVRRDLVRHDAGAHCPTCGKTVRLIGAFYWGRDHARDTGHKVLVDYQARYAVTAKKVTT